MADVVAIVQARLGSSRLPGKVLLPLCGVPVLEHVVQRLRTVSLVDRVVVATSRLASDDELADFASRLPGVGVSRGSESDVLDRYLQAAREFEAQTVIRITSDCPLLSPAITAKTVEAFLERAPNIDYVSNSLERTYPRGFDTEVFSLETLQRAHAAATDPAEREHVTLHVYRRPSEFRLHGVVERERPDPSLRLTIDTPEDYEMLSRIAATLYPEDPLFDWEKIRVFLAEHPEVREINAMIEQKKV
jgi:spore coat polysaccharide biosynthesis protein SpsF